MSLPSLARDGRVLERRVHLSSHVEAVEAQHPHEVPHGLPARERDAHQGLGR
ncbi:hypothetical protein [Parolsenella catena]|uniref:hypothetical protein n=1 Tax=Parolsenella catena TaxID=2003188 RepID=UPI003AF0EA84